MDKQRPLPALNTGTPDTVGSDVEKVVNKLTLVVPQEKGKDAERYRAKAVDQILRDLGPRYSPDRICPLAKSFEIYHKSMGAVIKRLADLAEALPDRVEAGDGVIFFGSVGTGKDHLLAWLLYHATSKHGLSSRWFNGQELFGIFRDRIDKQLAEGEYLQMLMVPQVLAISDPLPPAGDLSSWNIGLLYRILERRYRALRSTWFTFNCPSMEYADEKLSAPVLDRMRESSEIFQCFWPSYRERRSHA